MKPPERVEFVLPELGMGTTPIVASRWLVAPGRTVIEGDRLLEVLSGSATVDIPSPTSGILIEVLVQPGDRISIGQALAWIEPEA